MVDFTLTAEQLALRELAHEFAVKEVRPVAAQFDRESEFPRAIIDKAHAAGLMNTHVPRRYGGPGASILEGTLVEEEMAWGCAGIQTSVGCNGLSNTIVALGGAEELQAEYFGELMAAPRLASFCLTESEAGSDVGALRTRAVRRGDKYVINGSKAFITNAEHADFFVVLAKTDPGAGKDGVSAFLVRRDDSIVVDPKEDKLGHRASSTSAVTFNDTEVDARHLLGEAGGGFRLAMSTLDRSRPEVGSIGVGIARAAMEHATAYAAQREQFGAPIASNQAVRFMLADMATKVHLSRLAVWNAAVLADQGQRNTVEAAHAKRFAADTAMEVTTDAVQIFGGYGYLKSYPVEKLMRDAKLIGIYEGTSQIQRLVIAREMLAPK